MKRHGQRQLGGRVCDELLVLTAPDREDLARRAREAAARVRAHEALPLRRVAAEVGEARPSGPLALAIVADTIASLADKLDHAAGRLDDASCLRINDRSGIFFTAEPLTVAGGRVALMFPGEGSQYPGMLADLCVRFAEAREPFDRIDRVFEGRERDLSPSQIVFGDSGRDRIWDMDGAVEVVFSANAALHSVLASLGLRPDVMLGHSTGDYSALFAAGAVGIDSEGDLAAMMLGLNDLHQRLAETEVVQDTTLLAVGAGDAAEVEEVLAGFPRLELAMDNCPHQRVYAGPADVVAEARRALAARGAVLEELPFRRAYHTAAFWPALEVLRPFFMDLPLRAPRVELWSCATAAEVPADAEALRELVLRQWAMPVRFRATVEKLWERGVRIFVDGGPRGNLSAFVKDILRGRPHLAVACDGTHRPTVTHLLFALGQLAAHGVSLDLRRLAAPSIQAPPQRAEATDAEIRPRRRGPVMTLATGWPELTLPGAAAAKYAAPAAAQVEVIRRPEGPPAPAAVRLHASGPPPAGSPAAGCPPAAGRPVDERADVVTAHLELTRRVITAHERVLRRFLSGLAANPPPPAPAVRPPLLGDRVRMVQDGLEAEVSLDPARHRFLVHHTLGGRVSTVDPLLTALPVMPFTMTLELAAEAALALAPGWVCIGFENAVAHRWITFADDDGVTLQVTARRLEASACGAVVSVEVVGEDGDRHLSTEVRVAPGYPAAPAAAPAARSAAPLWDRDRIYREAMFHGPSFRGIELVGRLDEQGAEAVLEVLPRRGLLEGNEPLFATDPVLLDQPGQLVGVWTASRLSEGYVIFPTRLAMLELFSPPPRPGLRLGCRAVIRLLGDSGLSSDLEVDDGEGLLHARFSGWEDRRFHAPRPFLDLMLDPVHASPAGPREPSAAARRESSPASVRLARTDLPPGFSARGGIWQQVAAALCLAREERADWKALAATSSDAEQWLLTRLAAKEACRRWLRRRELAVPPADVVIADGSDGELTAGGRWTAEVGGELAVAVRYEAGGPTVEASCRPRVEEQGTAAGAGSGSRLPSAERC